MMRPITIDAASATAATTEQATMIAVTRRGERGTTENDRIVCAVNTQTYPIQSVTTTGKPKTSNGLTLSAAKDSDATMM